MVISQKILGKGLMDEQPNKWCDLNLDFGTNVPLWFRYFLQKAFVEAHSVSPSEKNIEGWGDGILFTLRGLNNFGPYVKAARDYNKDKEKSESFEKFYSEPGYELVFVKAIELSLIYMRAAFELYHADHLTEDEGGKFKEVIQNADLSAPLERDIYESALKALNEWHKN